MQERLLYYFSKLYSSQVHRGDNYKDAKRIILVAILDYGFDVTKGIAEFETIWKLRETKNLEKILTDKVEIHIIELAKVRSTYEQNKGNKKNQWMLFLDDPNSKEVQETMKENEEVKEAVVEVHKMTEDEKLQRLADLRQKAIMDEKAYLETAKELLKRGMSKEEVANIVHLDIKEIEKLK